MLGFVLWYPGRSDELEALDRRLWRDPAELVGLLSWSRSRLLTRRTEEPSG